MLPYLIVFIISIFSTFVAELSIKKNYRILFFLLSCVAILTPSLLAAFRDVGVGTDTYVYVDSTWHKFRYIYSINDFIKAYKLHQFEDIEFIYLLLNFIASRFGNSLSNIFFLTNFIVMLFIYLTAFDNRKKAPMWLVMTFFLFMYYNASLNLVRQSITLAFTIYSFKYLEQKKWLNFIIWFLIIIFAHNTGIFSVILIGIYFIFKINNKMYKRLIMIMLIIFVGIVFSYADYFIIFLVAKGLLPAKFLMYETSNTDSSLGKTTLLAYIILILILYYIYSKLKDSKDKNNLEFYTYSKLIGTFLYLTGFLSKWSYRISFYINYPVDCIFIPRALLQLKKKSKSRYIIITTLSILLVILMWFWLVVIRNENSTIPYKSKILNI